MQFKTIALAACAAFALAGCQWNDLERAGAGAAAGAVVATAAGGSLVTGAVVGGAAGALCDDVGLEICR